MAGERREGQAACPEVDVNGAGATVQEDAAANGGLEAAEEVTAAADAVGEPVDASPADRVQENFGRRHFVWSLAEYHLAVRGWRSTSDTSMKYVLPRPHHKKHCLLS
mmetsp:Transcript_70938/g.179556  ORF Transcript_70938/g.179556 Transcript_70938/m.179556 type:complete len:107 (+) Transcript_70938:161-481(+)